jgi:hypothetical protein
MRPALLLLAPALAAAMLLGSCMGRQFTALPPGSGQGRYSGEFKDPGGASAGTLTLNIDDNGVLRGSGGVGAYTVDLRGILDHGQVVAYITDEDTQRTGKFDGTYTAGTLGGTWEFDPTGTQTIQGTWDASLNP